VPEVTRLVVEARSMVRTALDQIDELPVDLELQEVERCLYAVDARLAEIHHEVRDSAG
jgi:hypothetical protein